MERQAIPLRVGDADEQADPGHLVRLAGVPHPAQDLAARTLDLPHGLADVGHEDRQRDAVTGTLNPLEEAGLIQRLRGEPPDRRVVRLRLTSRGRSVLQGWLESCRALIENRVSELGDSEKRKLMSLLSKIGPAHSGVPEGMASSLRPKARRRERNRGK